MKKVLFLVDSKNFTMSDSTKSVLVKFLIKDVKILREVA